MNLLLAIARYLVGLLFIFSGLIKANDPLGLSYKMQEFFEVWGVHALNSYTLPLSIGIISLEIIAGVAIILGWKMRFFTWVLLLLIVFFTFLTGYALFSGKIRECGCFGDCIPLQAHHSFIKDIILLVLILFLFINRNRTILTLPMRLSLLILFFATIFTFSFQWYVLQHMPVVDCLPFKVGNNIQEQMKIPQGALPDSTIISFVYEKEGKEVEFTTDRFPDDFDDSLYTFIRRYDKVVRKGNALPAIRDFSLTTNSGNDTTQAILTDPQYQFLIITNGKVHTGQPWMKDFVVFYDELKKQNIPFHFVTSNRDRTQNWVENALGKIPVSVLTCDAIAIKTAARVDPAFYLLSNGVVIEKWSYANLLNAVRYIRSGSTQ